MKKILLPFLAFCVVAALFIAFGSMRDNDKISAFGEKTKKENIIYIGVYEPLTGDYAQGGLSEALGIRYANSVCHTVVVDGVTYEIKLVESDNATDETGATIAAQALMNSKVSAVLGSYSNKATATGITEFEKNGIPLIGISCTSQSASEGSRSYFRMCYNDLFQSGIMANFAYSMDLRHAAILTQTGDTYSKAAGKIFSDAYKQLGGEVTEFSFQLGQENFRSLSKEIANSDADFVYMLSGSSEAKYFINQSRSEGLLCPVLGPESWDSALLLDEVSFTSADVYFASEFDTGSSADPVSIEFSKNFASWLNSEDDRIAENGGNDYASSASAMAYDSYMLVVEAIKKADSSAPSAVAEAIRAITYQGLTGSISFNEKGESLKRVAYIKTININSSAFELVQTSSIGS